MEEEDIFVVEEKIKEFIQDFLNMTKMGEDLGHVTLESDHWDYEIKRFKKTFPKEWNGEYKVSCECLFNFINEVMYHLVERVCEDSVKDGTMELLWDTEQNDFAYRMKGA